MDLTRCWFYTGSFTNISENINATYDFGIEWGDGTKTDYYKNINAVGNYLPVKHTYAKKGVYTATLTGDCDNLYQTGDTGYKDRIVNLKECLWGVKVPKNCVSPLKYAHASFFGCERLAYLGKGVFDNCTDCKTIRHLFDGAAIEYFHEYTLSGLKNLTDAQYCFEACKMKGIHPDIFKPTPNITSFFHSFHRCDKLKEIPSGLFDYTPKATNFKLCFRSCTAIEKLPENLFAKCPLISDVTECFAGGRINGSDLAYNKYMSIGLNQTETQNLPPLWNTHPGIAHGNYATGCIHASNYKEAVSRGWAF